MADFNKPKKPEANTPKPSASPTPSPKPAAPSGPAPKFNSGPSPKPTAPKQATTPNQAPKATPKLNGGTNPKPTAPKVDPVRQKIASQGFAPNRDAPDYYAKSPKGYGDTSKKLNNWGKERGIYIDEKSTKNYYDEEPDFWNVTGKNGFEIHPNEKGGYSFHRDGSEIGSVNNEEELFKYLDNWDDPENPENKKHLQELQNQIPDAEEEDWNNEDNPGSAVVSGRLMDYVRGKLSEDPELSPQFIDKMVKGLYNDSNQADYYKGKMKEDWERRKASKLYGTDLKEKNHFWPRDKNYQEPEGFKSEEWANADLEQKSDEDLVKMHDNLSQKLWHLQYRSPEEDALQSKIEREYLRRHPVNLDDE